MIFGQEIKQEKDLKNDSEKEWELEGNKEQKLEREWEKEKEKQNLISIPFSRIRSSDLSLVGGKGANLGEMVHANFPVPPGFCLTTNAFQLFINSHPDLNGLYKSLELVDVADFENIRKVGEQVRNSLMGLPIPKRVIKSFKHEWQKIGIENAYAVRSSATAEDLPDASFAGQQDTYLNIKGESALLDAIKRCWISLFTDRAIIYRRKNNFSHRNVRLCVIIQKMVMSEKSGILFTADPLTGHRHTLEINASFGLGEALVSGLVTPDTYRVDKRSNSLIYKQIMDKQVAIYPLEDGTTQQVFLNPKLRRKMVHLFILLMGLKSHIKDWGSFLV